MIIILSFNCMVIIKQKETRQISKLSYFCKVFLAEDKRVTLNDIERLVFYKNKYTKSKNGSSSKLQVN